MTGLDPAKRHHRRDRHDRHRRRARDRRRRARPRRAPAARGARRDGPVRGRHAHAVGPAAGDRRQHDLARGRRRGRRWSSSRRTCPRPARCRCAATRSAWTAASSTAYLPDIEHWLHYRSIDVSSIKELVQALVPDDRPCPPAEERHATGRSTTSGPASTSCGSTASTCSSILAPTGRVAAPASTRVKLQTASNLDLMHDQAQVKPRKQEQERATDEITELAPGVLRSQLPIDMPGLGHVNCYILEDERGVAIVDPGLPEQGSYDAIEARLEERPASRCRGCTPWSSRTATPTTSVVPRWVREQTGADIVTHRSFRVGVGSRRDRRPRRRGAGRARRPAVGLDPAVGCAAVGRRPAGVRRRRAPDVAVAASGSPSSSASPSPRSDCATPSRSALAGRDWFAVHTPGHTDDHLCLFDPTEGLMICGDHVLPTITPHIGGVGPRRRSAGQVLRVARQGRRVRRRR